MTDSSLRSALVDKYLEMSGQMALLGDGVSSEHVSPSTTCVDGSSGHDLRPYQQELLEAAMDENVRPDDTCIQVSCASPEHASPEHASSGAYRAFLHVHIAPPAKSA